MKIFFLVYVGAFLLFSHKHHEHGAHEHGTVELDVAFTGSQGEVTLHSPAESIYGFEHQAKKPADIAKRDAAIAKLEKSMGEMIAFDAGLACQWTSKKIEPEVREEGETHAEVHATFSLNCKKDPLGTVIKVDFKQLFPRVKTIKVQVVTDKKQTGATLKGGKGVVGL